MGKKKKTSKRKDIFQSDPFSDLKGFAVSATELKVPEQTVPVESPDTELSAEDLFAREMDMLGVQRSNDETPAEAKNTKYQPGPSVHEEMSDQEQFLAAMGEMSVHFEDHLPDNDESPQASPRRMKLLKQGRLQPEATLDLHGLLRHQVVEKVCFFLADAKFQGFKTLLIITGRGLHSQGEPVLRTEVENFLNGEGRPLLVEWARAPRQYGGEGALVVFLKND